MPVLGRADAEHDGVLVDGVDIALLVEGLGPDRTTTVGEDVLGEHLGGCLGRPFAVLRRAQHGDGPFHCVLRHRLSGAEHQHHLVEKALDEGHFPGVTDSADLIAPDVDIGRRKGFFDHAQ